MLQRDLAPRLTRLRRVAGLAAVLWLGAAPVSAQLPARTYWKSLSGANAVPFLYMSMNGNTNPVDPALTVLPGSHVQATIVPVGIVHTFAAWNRSAWISVMEQTGHLSGEVTAFGNPVTATASGFGDPLAEFDINVIGPKAIRNLPDLLRYEPGFSVDLLTDLVFPIGAYNDSLPLNMGLNRWYGRVAAPVVWQLGPWVPGRRTTLEFVPSLWIFGANNDYMGQVLKTDPLLQVEGHLTRDFARSFWASLDGTWFTGGRASIDGVAGASLNNWAVGYTLGYQVNKNLQTTVAYMTTINQTDPGDLQLDGFRFMLTYGWHPLIEGIGRLQGDNP
jgi:hypothetical protein